MSCLRFLLLAAVILLSTPVLAQDQYDYGDLPDPVAGVGPGNYNTLLSDNGPRHMVRPSLKLGAFFDPEPDGQPSPAADGDDINTLDDDDGVQSLLEFVAGSAAQVELIATNQLTTLDAQLCGFIDFNGDGDFDDPGERARAIVPNGATDMLLQLDFGAPPIIGFAPSSYARFRIDQPANIAIDSCSPVGTLPNGEVEDYSVLITGVASLSIGGGVWHDVDNNGIRLPAEPGLPGISVELYKDDDLDSTPDGAMLSSTVTDASGAYRFDGLDAGGYLARVVPPAGLQSSSGSGALFSVPSIYEPAPSPEDDQGGVDDGSEYVGFVQAGPMLLEPGLEPVTDGDADPDTNLTLDFGLVPVTDLAARWIPVPVGTPAVLQGQLIQLDFEILNQDSSNPASGELVVDIPVGLSLDDAGWALVGSQAYRVAGMPLAPGSSEFGSITLRADPSFSGLTSNVTLEVSASYDVMGRIAVETDSIHDNNPDNDVFINQGDVAGAGGDEDDHDRLQVDVQALPPPPVMSRPEVVPVGRSGLSVLILLVFVLASFAMGKQRFL